MEVWERVNYDFAWEKKDKKEVLGNLEMHQAKKWDVSSNCPLYAIK